MGLSSWLWLDGIELKWEEKALGYVVEKALEYKLGARGLRSICEAIMMDAMFEMPSSNEKEFKLTAEYAKQKFDYAKIKMLKVA